MEYGQNPTTPTIQASATNISKENLDCGIKSLGWCIGPACQKFASLRIFITTLVLAASLQGAIETYFRISTKQAALDHDYDPTLVSWLLVMGGIFQALIALLIAFFAQKYHPISWLSGCILIQTATIVTAIIPSLTHFPFEQFSAEPENIPKICSQSSSWESMDIKAEKYFAGTTLVMLFILQLGIAIANTALYTIGIIYIDDNAESTDTPALIGVVLGARIWGSQLGTIVSLVVTWTGVGWWLGWAIIFPVIFTAGILVSLFPRKLIKTVVKQAASLIMESTTNSMSRVRNFAFIDDVNFLPSMKRLMTNKILMFNFIGLTFIELAIVNFLLQESNYLQSRYYLPTDESNGLTDEWLSRFLSYLLRPPVVGLCILLAGLIISKLNPAARSITAWNIGAGAVLSFLFLVYMALECSKGSIAGTYRGKLSQPFCSRGCICSPLIPFTPICPENSTQTYFSPCHAGCKKETVISGISIYENCTCGVQPDFSLDGLKAIDGACNLGECQLMWIIFQILTVVSAGLFASTLIGKIIISIRVVLPQDKSLALALGIFLTGIITYIPGKLIYDGVSYNTCQYWSQNYEKCYLQENPIHGNVINGISTGFIIIGIIFDIFVYIFVEDVDCFPINQEIDPGFGTPLERLSPRAHYSELALSDGYESQTDTESPLNRLMILEDSPRHRVVQALVENPKITDGGGATAGSTPDQVESRINNNNSNNNNNNSNLRNEENLDFRIQTPTDTTQPESSVRSLSSDLSSERSESPYIRELRNRMDLLQQKKARDRLPSHETDL